MITEHKDELYVLYKGKEFKLTYKPNWALINCPAT